MIELLIAVTIFAIIIAGFYGAFSVSISAHIREEHEKQYFQNARLVLNKFAAEFQNALYTSNLGLGGKATELYFYYRPEREIAEQPVRLTYKAKKSGSDLALIRESTHWAQSFEKKSRRSAVVQELAFPLKNVKFLYYKELENTEKEESFLSATSKEERVFEWVESWKAKEGFPLGIKIVLQYPEQTFVRFIPSQLMFHKAEEKNQTLNPLEIPQEIAR